MSKSQSKRSAKVGESVDFDGKPFYMRLPDGTVVTARGVYAFAHEGEHVAVVDGTEHPIEVAAK